MKLEFDLEQDELPIYLAETDEQLQILDEGLIRLEREEDDEELVQLLFRAAHTLKGTAGMIGHKRMVTVTHALENALDEVRKHTLIVSTAFIDLCLEAVDNLRILREEAVDKQASSVNVEELAGKFTDVGSNIGDHSTVQSSGLLVDEKLNEIRKMGFVSQKPIWIVHAKISQNSIASAARALQVVLALQNFGEIKLMDPSQTDIEAAKPVGSFYAVIETEKSQSEIQETLDLISEIDSIEIESYDSGVQRGFEDHSLCVIEVKISSTSIASAARAFQVMLALQEHSEIVEMEPSLVEIETAKPISKLVISLDTEQDEEFLKENIESIVDIEGVRFLSSMEESLKIDEVTHKDAVEDEVKEEMGITAAKAVEARKASAQTPQNKPSLEKTVRTSVERLDNLMNLVGELITDRNRMFQIRNYFELKYRNDDRVEMLAETITHVGRITDQLQMEVMGIRMQPVSTVFHKFPRMVRDLSKKLNKKIDLVIKGEDTELDRSVIEEITDPLVHLVRNSVDHGSEDIEERLKLGKPERSTILLDARHEQGRIIITVEDDGNGIDSEKILRKAISKGMVSETEAASMSENEAINLVFASGLSTADALSDISGRGVGLDIVRNNIQRLNGEISIETWQGRGTRFQITLPLTLAIVPTLLVKVGPCIIAIPLITVSTTIRITDKDIKMVNNVPVTVLRERVLPLLDLNEAFKFEKKAEKESFKHVVVVGTGSEMLGIIVDDLLGQEEVVVKSLGPIVGDVFGVASAAILGDGQIILIADIQDLFKYNVAKTK
ncbi:MAG: chemotaxis protein CheA [Anaerolineaceae bacterium]|nr:chemotaxis protein CheA [Anaerolineaceae bacterium]